MHTALVRVVASAAATLALATTTTQAAADVVYVRCQFSVDQSFVYDIGGAKYAGSPMNTTDCQTNLSSAQITLEFNMQVGYGTQGGGAVEVFRREYLPVIDVQNGGSYSVQFPNDDQLIALKPGSYMTSGAVTSSLEGFEHPKFVNTKNTTWGVDWGTLPHMS